ncbi:MAG: SDR family oxidoreductase [Proteobacteria bacterium]|nr:SDR family oxidoreductase [Pseudomonadota bacterium]
MRIMITGGSGFLGWNLCLGLRKRHEVFGSYIRHPFALDNCSSFKLDLTSQGEIRSCIEQIKPDVIIHTAAITNPDQCEKNRPLAKKVNGDATRILAQICQDHAIRLIYTSTDLVFNGNNGLYTEEDKTDPLNFYGETKLAGELAIKELLANFVVVRVTLMYGWGNGMNGCFTDWMLSALEKKDKLHLFTDQYRTPTLVNDTVTGIIKVIEEPHVAGVFHLAGPERVNRVEFGRVFVDTFGFSRDLIQAVKQDEIPALVPRPKDSSLSIRKFQERYHFTPKGIKEGIKTMFELRNQS